MAVLDSLGYFKNTHKNPKFGKVRQFPTGEFPTTLPNLGFLWVFFKYPKISKNGNLLFFPVLVRAPGSTKPPCYAGYNKKNRSLNLHMTKSSNRFVANTKVVDHFAVNCQLLLTSRSKTASIKCAEIQNQLISNAFVMISKTLELRKYLHVAQP